MNVRFPAIHSISKDSTFILLPPFLVCAVLFFLPTDLLTADHISPITWLALVVFIDVSHVYSTLYRSYFNPEEFSKHRRIMIMIPLICLAVGMLLYSLGSMVFWRCLAYLAVYHFVRQQYGFMRLYARHDQSPRWRQRVESIIVYGATIYPLLYWHIRDIRTFHWFVDGDFISLSFLQESLPLFTTLYFLLLIIWLVLMVDELRQKSFNLPKHAVIAGTVVSWYFGIVYFEGDLTFTALNVLSHGIPYMALIWFANQKQKTYTSRLPRFGLRAVFVFALIMLIPALIEEGIWDILAWRDHPEFFGKLYVMDPLRDKTWLAIAVPLLSLPQMTHYVLDGFIWRRPQP